MSVFKERMKPKYHTESVQISTIGTGVDFRTLTLTAGPEADRNNDCAKSSGQLYLLWYMDTLQQLIAKSGSVSR